MHTIYDYTYIYCRYKRDVCEFHTDYLWILFLGVGMVLRKMGNTVSPTVEITQDGDTYTLTTTSTFKTSAISFKLGEEFDEETLDGRKVKSVITLDGNKLTQEQKGDKPSTIVREFTDSELITVSLW